MADQTPKPKQKRPSLPRPRGAQRPIYGKPQKKTKDSITVMVSLHPDSAAAVMDLVARHNISRGGAAHHLIRFGAGLPPLPPLD